MTLSMATGYDIHICSQAELPGLRKFIHENWKPNHILTLDPMLMDWQHRNVKTGEYNFLIATNTDTQSIDAVLGFIPTSHFDDELPGCEDLWLAIWKVREGVNAGGLGLAMFQELTECRRPSTIGAIGINDRVAPVYRYLGFSIVRLNHYYMVNVSGTEFELVGDFDGRFTSESKSSAGGKTLAKCERKDVVRVFEGLDVQRSPRKSVKYYISRYLEHPVYDYEVYAISEDSVTQALLVFRVASHGSHHALRIVDYYGDPRGWVGLHDQFQELLQKYDAEYIDFYNLGIDEEVMQQGGFIKRGSDSKVVVPNYFEPFEKRNVEIDCAIRSESGCGYFIVKGDSDQDRPNVIGREN